MKDAYVLQITTRTVNGCGVANESMTEVVSDDSLRVLRDF